MSDNAMTDHLDGCCLLNAHVVPLDCEVPDESRKPIVLPPPRVYDADAPLDAGSDSR